MAQGNQRSNKKLTAAKINGNLNAGKYHDGGGTGLFLRVEPNGSRRWGSKGPPLMAKDAK